MIVPTRNAASGIDACLSSLWAQSCRDYEVLVLDGQSTDGTLQKLQSHAARFGQALRWHSEPDAGVYHAMNRGIAHARGEWLHFLGADDVLHDPEVLADVVRFMATRQADIVYGDVVERASGARYGGEFSLDRLLFECNICHQAVYYRRSVFEKLGGYNTRYPIWADWDFNIRCFRHPGMRAIWTDRVIAVYRARSGISRVEDPVFRRELPATLLRDARLQRGGALRRWLRTRLSRWLGDSPRSRRRPIAKR